MRRIAITGGIAEGKSTVLGYLSEAGYITDSVDVIAREVFERPETQAAIRGTLELDSISPVDVRKAIAEDPQKRRQLNRIMHPAIIAALKESRAQVIEVPLLIETCLQGSFDRIWVVTCGPEEQLNRVQERLGKDESARFMALQLRTSAKTPFADLIVRTNVPEPAVKSYVLAQVENELGDVQQIV